MTCTEPRALADAIRFLSIDAIERVGEGHPGTPLGAADTVTALFTRHLKFLAREPLWFDRDRFVESNGHGSMLLYSLLHLSGYEGIGLDDIKRFRELGSPCEGHPEYAPAHGIETTTGPLGQGIANAAGMALAEAYLNRWLGPDIIDHRTYALVGDGCLQEGIGQEVISLAGHLRLGKLTFLWDDNQMTDDGAIDLALSDDMSARFRLSHWHVQEVDGHDSEAVSAALLLAKADPRPSMIRCTTVIGRGLPGVEGTRAAHSARIPASLSAAARKALNWPHPAFEIPEEIRAAWRAAGERNAPAFESWTRRVAALPPERRRLLDRLREGKLPEGWDAPLRAFREEAARSGKAQSGIALSGELVDRLAEAIPELLSGAPDLEGATQHKRSLKPFTAEDQGGRYVHYGIREHAMGAMMNGMAAHGGVVPVGVTYLVFSDYLRPVLRLAAMMGLPVPFVFSHDSIGIGRNGPTHQPVEYLASLRAIPNMLVLRPADAVEAAECWQIALQNRTGPSSLIFARQVLPALRRDGLGENRSARGAYVLEEASGPRRVTLLATGSEVSLAVEARRRLEEEGIPTAVVSMPSWELFERQDASYRRATLGSGTVRVGIEAAVRLGWDRYLGEEGGFVGMSGFGASGAEADLARHFGLTPERVVEEARARL
ncbi:transketolase family protein [Methylobacterium frigidaeris]|uniref:Transketolase n=1 Tax=Methylobacterium frigidaeris TaxID=2038277 RepID=A0AA37HDA1_9HYPH|nr:transketolase [Methylobacterium frigidaeris]PIK69785.1 transketolase [Methylobacterium frigidaeris]GJD63867.1 Transketolase [Methylobacterium frigidaeris]